jgi:hypothetical protein
MPTLLHLIAQANPLNPPGLPESSPAAPQLADKNTMIVLAAVVVIAAVAFFWAFFMRKRPKNARGTIMVDRRSSGSGHAFGSSGRRRRRKRRDDHPENLPRNPTLSETGGLPPPRPEEPDSSTPSGSSQSS